MSNARLYHNDPYATGVATKVKYAFADDGKQYVVLADDLFFPRGGGQRGDRGTIRVGDRTLNVVDTVKDTLSSDLHPMCIVEGEIEGIQLGTDVDASLDWDHRFKQMRLHSAVHLHHCLMESVLGRSLPIPSTSELQSDGTAYNRYESEEVTEDLARKAFAKMLELISAGGAITTRDDPERVGYRYWEFDGYTVPCGGTHLRDVAEIGGINIDFSVKKRRPKVGFTLTS